MLNEKELRALEGSVIRKVIVNKNKVEMDLAEDGVLTISPYGDMNYCYDALGQLMNIKTKYIKLGNKYYREAVEASKEFRTGVYKLATWELSNIIGTAEENTIEALKESQYVFAGNNPFTLLRRVKLPVNPSSVFIAWLNNIGCVASQVDFDNGKYNGHKVHIYSYEEFRNLLINSCLGGEIDE